MIVTIDRDKIDASLNVNARFRRGWKSGNSSFLKTVLVLIVALFVVHLDENTSAAELVNKGKLLSDVGISVSDQKGGGKTFWVSKNFLEAPNVNLGKDFPDFAPQIISLDHLKTDANDGDVRLCFDNRSFHKAHLNSLVQYPSGNELIYCEKHDVDTGVGYYVHPNREFGKKIRNGLLISINEENITTCEAIFTVYSMFDILKYNNPNTFNSNIFDVKSYGSGVVYLHSIKNFYKYIDNRDVFETSDDNGGREFVTRLDLRNTWKCLVPAFRIYWSSALKKCSEGAKLVQENASIDSIYHPLISELRHAMLKSARKCLIVPNIK